MKITEINIENFKSIEKVDIKISELGILVGQNNHGKTNFLDAVDWFFNDTGEINSIVRKGVSNNMLKVEMVFDGAQEALDKMKNEKNSQTIRKKIGSLDIVKIIKEKNDKEKFVRKIWAEDSGEYIDPGTGFDKALNDFLPNIEYVRTENSLKEILKYGKNTQIGNMLSGVLNEILSSGDESYKKFVEEFSQLFSASDSKISVELNNMADKVKKYLIKQFPETSKIDFQVKNPELSDLFKNFTAEIDDGVVTDACEKGDGMQRALMLAIIQTYADYRRENLDVKNFVFLIDEGELHLHPTAQRSLKNAIIDLASGGDQILLSTHSSVLIADDCSCKNVNQKIFKVTKYEDGITEITEENFESRQQIVYELLGGSPADLLMPSNFLIVEGKSELIFLNRVISRFYQEFKSIKILPAHGDMFQATSLVSSLEKIFTPLSESIYSGKYIVCIDKQKIGEQAYGGLLKKISDFNAEEQLIELTESSIEEYYPEATPDQLGDSSNSREYLPKWKRNKKEVESLKSKQKIRMAELIAERITMEQFENSMPVFFKALKKAEEKSFK
jgi:putative ATP-dependent endonuclease of OLD family